MARARVFRRRPAGPRTRARLRPLPRLPSLLQPVQLVSAVVRRDRRRAVRRTRWRRQEGVLGGGRSLLPLRHVLPLEMSLRAPASMEHRFPAPDAAREGSQVQAGRNTHARPDPELDRHGRHARRHSSRVADRQQGKSHGVRPPPARPDARRASCSADSGLSQHFWPHARRARAHSGRHRGQVHGRDSGQGRAVRHLLLQSQ
jgi:hypothetical protein